MNVLTANKYKKRNEQDVFNAGFYHSNSLRHLSISQEDSD